MRFPRVMGMGTMGSCAARRAGLLAARRKMSLRICSGSRWNGGNVTAMGPLRFDTGAMIPNPTRYPAVGLNGQFRVGTSISKQHDTRLL